MLTEEQKRLLARFTADYALTAEYANNNPHLAQQAWDKFYEVWRDDNVLAQLREVAVAVRLDPPTT